MRDSDPLSESGGAKERRDEAPAGPPDEHPGIADPTSYLRRETDGRARLDLLLANVSCPSCIRVIEQTLNAMPGVTEARVNFSTRRLGLLLDPKVAAPRALLAALEERGFHAVPFDPTQLADADNAEDRRLLRALAVAGFAAANVMLLSVSVWAGLHADMGPATRSLFHWISAIIAVPAIAYAGQPFFGSAMTALRHRRMNMDVPISLAVLLATAMSFAQTLGGGEAVYFEAALMLLFFLLIGRSLDQRLRSRARSAVQHLLALRAIGATVLGPDGERSYLPVQSLRPGARVLVAAGERVPVDGMVRSGASEIDASLVTGESLPQRVGVGDQVYAGTTNLTSSLEIAVSAAHESTLLAEIVRLMEAAEQGRARYVRLADRLAAIYAPAVHVLAAATFLGWLLIAQAGWEAALTCAIAVLIITCPCALGLAVPAVQVVASGMLLRRGVLVKSGDGLEKLADADSCVLDKTGTLTEGRPELVDPGRIPRDALRQAASLASASLHPLCRAVMRAAGPVPVASAVHEEPGMGLEAEIDGRRLRLGNRQWCGLEAEAPNDEAELPELWLCGEGGKPVQFQFRDALRPDAGETIAWLQENGFETALLSGDREGPVRGAAEMLGIARWQSLARPADKIARLGEMAAAGRRTLMVGDGLNDAPALAAAHVSMSPASGADVSQAAADLVFQGSRLRAVVDAVRIARGARQLVLQNFALALAYNAIAVPLAVAGVVTPLIAAVAMSASSILVTANALRLRLGSSPGREGA